MIDCRVGVVSVTADPAVLKRMRAMLLPSRRKTGLGRVFPWELLAKESLQLSYATSCAARFRVCTACSSGYARYRGASIVVEVCGLVRVGAGCRSLSRSNIQRAQSRRHLRGQRHVVARVVIEACRNVGRATRRRNRTGALACHPRRDLTQRTRMGVIVGAGLAPAIWFDTGQVAAVIAKVAHPMFAEGGIYAGAGGRRRQSET